MLRVRSLSADLFYVFTFKLYIECELEKLEEYYLILVYFCSRIHMKLIGDIYVKN